MRPITAKVTLTGKCTTCKKTWPLTQEQEYEARGMGCAFSPCCNAVATIELVEWSEPHHDGRKATSKAGAVQS